MDNSTPYPIQFDLDWDASCKKDQITWLAQYVMGWGVFLRKNIIYGCTQALCTHSGDADCQTGRLPLSKDKKLYRLWIENEEDPKGTWWNPIEDMNATLDLESHLSSPSAFEQNKHSIPNIYAEQLQITVNKHYDHLLSAQKKYRLITAPSQLRCKVIHSVISKFSGNKQYRSKNPGYTTL
jgi:hypothetical protein